MNSSMRNIALALLVAFAGAQVNAMDNTKAIISTQHQRLIQDWVDGLSELTKKEAIAAANAANEIKSNEAAQGRLQSLQNGYYSAQQVLGNFVTAYPILAKCGIFVTGVGVVTFLVYKIDKNQVIYKKLCGAAQYVKDTVNAYPKTSKVAGFAAAAGLSLFALQKMGYVSPAVATIGTHLAHVSTLLEPVTNKLPSLDTIKSYLTTKTAGVTYALGAVFGTLYSAKKAQAKAALPAPAQNANAQPAQNQESKKLENKPSIISRVFGNSKKQREEAAAKAAQEVAQRQAEFIAHQLAQKQQANLEAANLQAAQAVAKKELVTILNAEMNGTAVAGTALNFASANFSNQQNIVALVKSCEAKLQEINKVAKTAGGPNCSKAKSLRKEMSAIISKI